MQDREKCGGATYGKEELFAFISGRQKFWHCDDNVLKRISEAPEHVFLSAELAGRKLSYGRRREAGYSELLSFTWPAAISL